MWSQPTASEFMPPNTIPGMVQPLSSSDRSVFSGAWNALRFPGTSQSVPKTTTPIHGLYPATVALCRTLLKSGRTIWIDQPGGSPLHQWCLWHTEGLIASSPKNADFTLVTHPSRLPALYHLNVGDGRNPTSATTLLIQVPAFDPKAEFMWDPKKTSVSPQDTIRGLPMSFWRQRMELQEILPWGIDIFFIHKHSFVALPRSMTVTAAHPAAHGC